MSLTTSSGPVGTIIRFISFSERDFRYVSLAFLKAMIVAVSPAFGTGDVDRLRGDIAQSTGGGARLIAAAGSHGDEGVVIELAQRSRSRIVVVIENGHQNLAQWNYRY